MFHINVSPMTYLNNTASLNNFASTLVLRVIELLPIEAMHIMLDNKENLLKLEPFPSELIITGCIRAAACLS